MKNIGVVIVYLNLAGKTIVIILGHIVLQKITFFLNRQTSLLVLEVPIDTELSKDKLMIFKEKFLVIIHDYKFKI